MIGRLPAVRPPELLDAFLLGVVDFQAAWTLQQMFVRELSSAREHRACLLLCEHPAFVSQGTGPLEYPAELEPPDTQESTRVDCVPMPRGGGRWEHGPGQLAIYPVFCLKRTELSPLGFRDAWEELTSTTCQNVLGISDVHREPGYGLTSRGGTVARTALRVTGEMTSLGMYLNVTRSYDLDSTRKCTSLNAAGMKRLEMGSVKSELIQQLAAWLGSTRVHTYTRHPALRRTWRPQDHPP